MNDKTTIPKRLRVMRRSCRLYGLRTMLTLLLLLCATPAFSQAQWTEVKLPNLPWNTQLMTLVWADALDGYLFERDDGFFFKTTNGGYDWVLDSLPAGPDSILHLWGEFSHAEFKDREFGFVTFKNHVGFDTVLYCTTDAGASWKISPVSNPSWIKYWDDAGFTQIRAHRNRGLYKYYARIYDDRAAEARIISYSSDLGDTWRVIAADTLRPGELGFPSAYVMIDSLTHYHFTTNYNMGEFSYSYAKMTTDGGATWVLVDWQEHPLYSGKLRFYALRQMRMINDTSIAVILDWPGDPFGPDNAAVTRHLKNHVSGDAWVQYIHPFKDEAGYGKTIVDFLYTDGLHIVHIVDSLVIYRENVSGKAIKILTPKPSGRLYLQPDGRLWFLFDDGLWVLDLRTLGGTHDAIENAPGLYDLECYPIPLNQENEAIILEFFSAERHKHVTISIHDVCGKRLYEKVFPEIAQGANTLFLRVADIAIRNLSVNAVLLISLRTADQSLFTKSLFLNCKY